MAGVKPRSALAGFRPPALPKQPGARLSWEARRAWRRLGWSAAAGLICAALAVLAAWQTHLLRQQQFWLAIKLRAAQSSGANRTADSGKEGDKEDDKDGDIANRLSAFYAYLPPHDAIPDQLKQLVNVAEKSGMTLAQAEYKPQADSHADFLRYQITLPVKADYSAVQNFIVRALRELPALTLDSVAFKRDRIETGEVEARIQFVLLVRKPMVNRVGK